MTSTTSFYLFSFVTLVVVITCFAAGTEYEKCKGVAVTAAINKVTVNPCPAVPCQLKKGSNVSVDVDFTMQSKTMAMTATTSVHGVIAGVPVPYKTNYHDACKTAGLKCPLKPSSRNIYSAKLYVDKFYPSINLYVKWELVDETQKDIFCFEIPVTIVG